jgi:hypothetical protein
MSRKRNTPEQIIRLLREAEVGLAQRGRRQPRCVAPWALRSRPSIAGDGSMVG